MDHMETLIEHMSPFNFSPYETRAYCALLQKSPMNGHEVSRAAGIPPSKIYETLQRLHQKGAVLIYHSEPTLYAPAGTRLSFMTADHHLVRNFVVCELPRHSGNPLRPEDISRRVNMPLARVDGLLDDLEKHLFFLVRNEAGEVSWAFPVTCEKTPHRLSFSTGERTFQTMLWNARRQPCVARRAREEKFCARSRR